jgi:hypothetical protein
MHYALSTETSAQADQRALSPAPVEPGKGLIFLSTRTVINK